MTVLFAIAMSLLLLAPFVSAVTGRGAAAASATGGVLLVIVGLAAALGSANPVLDLGGWLGFGRSALRADPLAGVFLALSGVTTAATGLAALERPPGRWLTALGSVLVLAVAVAIGSDNAFLFFLAWETLTVCIYLIASSDAGRPGQLLQGYLTAGLTKLGGAALLAAFALLYAHTHSFSLEIWAHASLSAGTRGLLFALLLFAFGTKIGVVPVHGALPSGYGASPRLGAAWLSVALAAGFYGLWRFVFDIAGPLPTWCGDATLILGAITAVAGIAYAITQDDLRRFLGYSTVEQAGIVLLGFGVALLGQTTHNSHLAAAGLLAATLQVCAASLAKTLALIGIDRVEQATGQRTIDPLGGLARRMPLCTAGVGIAAFTLAAIPPLGGFVSEWFTFEALLQGFRMPTLLSQLLCALAAAALAFTAGLALLAFAKYFGFIFLARARTAIATSTETLGRSASIIGLGTIMLFLGAAAPWEIHAISSGLQSTARLRRRGSGDQSPARARAGVREVLRACPDMADDRHSRVRHRRAPDRPRATPTRRTSRARVGHRQRCRTHRRPVPTIGLLQPDARHPPRPARLPQPTRHRQRRRRRRATRAPAHRRPRRRPLPLPAHHPADARPRRPCPPHPIRPPVLLPALHAHDPDPRPRPDPHPALMFQRFLLAWDGSAIALRALDVAIDMTRRYDGELIAVSIAHTPAHAETTADREESFQAAYRYLQESFDEVRDRADRAGVAIEHQIIDGDHAARALIDHAHQHGFDLIICGQHHSRRAGRLLLHGVAEDLVQAATIPVLVIGEPTE